MTDCCELLIAEHRHTEELVGLLETLLHTMVSSGDQTRPALPEIQANYQCLADDLHRHYALEEKALFPLLSQYRTMILMEVEHDDLLGLQDAFAQHLSQITQGQPEYIAKSALLLQRFHTFKERLFAHILEEERGIFPLANQVLEPEEKLKLLRLTNDLIEADTPKIYGLERKIPGFKVQKVRLDEAGQRPMEYQALFEQEHAMVQTFRLRAGQKQALHWAGQTQFYVVLSGELTFEADGEVYELHPGDTVTVDSRLLFALSALTDALLVIFKVWPHPHYTKA